MCWHLSSLLWAQEICSDLLILHPTPKTACSDLTLPVCRITILVLRQAAETCCGLGNLQCNSNTLAVPKPRVDIIDLVLYFDWPCTVSFLSMLETTLLPRHEIWMYNRFLPTLLCSQKITVRDHSQNVHPPLTGW